MNKPELIQKIKQLDGITLEEKAHLIELLNGKKYGLVWGDKPEDAEELLRKQLPALHEVVERRIEASPAPSEGGEKEASQTIKPSTLNRQTSLFECDHRTAQSCSLPSWGRSDVVTQKLIISLN